MRGKPKSLPPGVSPLWESSLASQCPSAEPQPSPPSACPQHLPQVPGGGPQGRRVLGGADGHYTAGHQGQGLVSAWGEGLGVGPSIQVPHHHPAPHLQGPLMGLPSACRFAARPDCGSKYQLCVQLLSSAHAPLGTFQPDPATIQQKSDAKWREVCGAGRGQWAHCPRLRLHTARRAWVRVPALLLLTWASAALTSAK